MTPTLTKTPVNHLEHRAYGEHNVKTKTLLEEETNSINQIWRSSTGIL